MHPTILIILGVILVPLLWSCVIITPGKIARVIEFLGKPERKARQSGLSFKAPWPFARIAASVNLQQQEIRSDVNIKTSDNAFMTLPVKVQFAVSDAVRAFYELDDPEQQMASYVLNNVRQTGAMMTMEELYKNRDRIENSVLETLKDRFEQYGFEIRNVLVDEPQPSEEVRDAFNRVIASEREKEAATNIAEAERIRLVGIAKAEKESQKLKGEGLSDMRQAIATGIKESMDTLIDAQLTPENALMLLMHTNHLDTLGSAANHGNMIITDMQSSTIEGGNNLANMMGVFTKLSAQDKKIEPKKKAENPVVEEKEDDDSSWDNPEF